jgi:hypothetical protein
VTVHSNIAATAVCGIMSNTLGLSTCCSVLS